MELAYLSPEQIRSDWRRSWAVVGPRNSGKTTWALHSLVETIAPVVDLVVVVTRCLGEEAAYRAVCPGALFFPPDNNACLERLKHLLEANGGKFKIFFVFDSVGADPKFLKSQVMLDLVLNSRHHNAGVALVVQSSLLLPPCMRSNIDHICALRDSSLENIVRLWKDFFGVFPSLKSFQRVYNAATKNYGVLVFSRTCQETKWSRASSPSSSSPRPPVVSQRAPSVDVLHTQLQDLAISGSTFKALLPFYLSLLQPRSPSPSPHSPRQQQEPLDVLDVQEAQSVQEEQEEQEESKWDDEREEREEQDEGPEIYELQECQEGPECQEECQEEWQEQEWECKQCVRLKNALRALIA